MLFCTFYLLLQPLLELGSKSTSLSSEFSDVIKAARYDLLIYIASFLDQGLFLEMWGGWMLSSDVAGVLQEAWDAYSRAPHLIPSLKFRLPYLINVHQSSNPFLLKSRGMKYCPSGKTPDLLINACGSLNCSFIMTSVMLTTFIYTDTHTHTHG